MLKENPASKPDSVEAVMQLSHSSLARVAIERGLLTEERPLLGFIDIEGVRQTVATLKQAFPDHFDHYFAAKANGMCAVLKLLREAGMLAETASPGELKQATRAGFTGREIVFDEPAKTPSVIRDVLSLGAALHVDNFMEMDRVCKMLHEFPHPGEIGYRINPQVGSGSIKAMSTAGMHSKFGVALEDEGNRERIIGDYLDHSWLNTVHTHVGSQGCPFDLVAEGITKVVALAEEVNQRAGEKRIRSIDIGGGLGVNFSSEEITPSFQEYSDFLRSKVPQLFTGKYRVKTEFGRSVMAKNGCIISRVEYTKISGGRHIATIHAGAQVATRTIFMPDSWPLRLSAFDANGEVKTGLSVEQDIAGPCCFAGDVVAHRRNMVKLEGGDLVMLHDTGAYYFSNPFFYNSLPVPAVYGYLRGDDDEILLEMYRDQQTLDDVINLIG
jgi:diaminopimelate decarboxylase